jgi:hypothetical protein
MNITIQVEGTAPLLAKLARLLGGGLGGSATVGTDLYYARYVHDGTRYMRARPFLDQAATSETPRVLAILGEGVRDLIEGGGGSLAPALLASGQAVLTRAQANTPVKTGRLRASEHVEVYTR